MYRKLILILAASLLPGFIVAQTPDFSLSAAPELQDSGFLHFLMPRFSLKTRIRPVLEANNPDAELFWNTENGQPVMQGLGQVFFVRLASRDTAETQKAQRFVDWLMSEIGQRTIEQFTVDGVLVFTAVQTESALPPEITFTGNVIRGEDLAFANCARCHEIGTRNLMKGIGSTPSFGLLRGLPDWQERFMTFYLRLPHPSITQIEGITQPFDPARPPSIIPLILTDVDLEDILGFVATVEPVDLGAVLQEHQ